MISFKIIPKFPPLIVKCLRFAKIYIEYVMELTLKTLAEGYLFKFARLANIPG